jgi:integrase
MPDQQPRFRHWNWTQRLPDEKGVWTKSLARRTLLHGHSPSIVGCVSLGSQEVCCDPSSADDAGRTPASQLLSEHCPFVHLCVGPEHIRQYQAYLFRERKLSPGTIEGLTAALRFLFVKTLRRPYLPDHIPFPKRQRRLPTILDQQEVARLIDSASNLMHRTMMMMLYATGLRLAEMCHLKVSDIDSKRMVIHVREGKGGP